MSREAARLPQGLARVGVVMPARDEAASLVRLLPRLKSFGLGQVVVADNASADETGRVARELGADVVREDRIGYGAACAAALGVLRDEIDIVVFLDADLADDSSLLPTLVAPLVEDVADLVIGVRPASLRERAAMTPPQVFGNRLAVQLIWLLWGYRYTDLGPFRAIRRSSLERLAMADRRFGWTVEMQVRALQERLRVCEVEVPYRARPLGRSKISGTAVGVLKAGGSILYTLARLWWRERWHA